MCFEISYLCYLGVAHNGVDQIQVEGQEVLVIGTGAVGLFAIAVAKAKGMCRFPKSNIISWEDVRRNVKWEIVD